MLPLGIHLSYWQRQWDDDLGPLLGRARAAGYDGVELPVLDPVRLPVAALRAELRNQGLRATCGTGLGPATDITSADPAVRAAGVYHLQRCLSVCAEVGSPVLGGVTYAPWGQRRPPGGADACRERAAESLARAAETAADLGVTLCLELLNRFEGWLIGSVAEGLALVRAVDSPRVRLHLDTFHLNIESDDIAADIIAAGSDLGHFHCSENNRRLPGRGHIPWAAVAGALRTAGYGGWLTVESFVLPDCPVGQDLNIWRPLADDLDQEAAAAAACLRTAFAAL